MKFSDNITTEDRYLKLRNQEMLSYDNLGELIRYPFKSLASYCTDLDSYDIIKIKRIENLNILNFYNALRIVLGQCSENETEVFNRYLSVEPLKSAVLASRLYQDNRKSYITFIKSACKIILTTKQNNYNGIVDPINVKISGTMPRNFLKSRQFLGDKWFNDFIDCKLFLLERLILFGVCEDLFPMLATSIAYSIFSFSPDRYFFINNNKENEAIYLILQDFIKNTSQT